MAGFERIVHRVSRELDRLAGWLLAAAAAFVLANIIARILGSPIAETYEFVGFLTAVMVGFALAHCGVQKGHVIVSVVLDRLPQRTQIVINIILDIITIVIIGLITWQLGLYGTFKLASGELSETATIPFYPFIYLVGLGFALLSLVLLVDVFKAVARWKGGARE